MKRDFGPDGSPLDCPRDDFQLSDFPPDPMRALASATSPEHGSYLQQLWQLLRRVL
jgi:hypothetical protein